MVTRTRHDATSYVHCLSCLPFYCCAGLYGHNVNNTHFCVIGHCPVSHSVILRHQLTPAPTLPKLQLVDLGRVEMSSVHITFGPDGYIHCWLNKSRRIGEAWFPEIDLNLPPDLTFLSCVSPFFSCPIFFLSFRGNTSALLRRSECLSLWVCEGGWQTSFCDLFELKWSVASTRNLWNVRRLADPTASYLYHQQ